MSCAQLRRLVLPDRWELRGERLSNIHKKPARVRKNETAMDQPSESANRLVPRTPLTPAAKLSHDRLREASSVRPA